MSQQDPSTISQFICSPSQGFIATVLVNKGDSVSTDQPLVIIEAQGERITVEAELSGQIVNLPFKVGDEVLVG